MARDLRSAGVGVEVYPDAKKIGVQLQYAERKGSKAAVIAGPDEFATGTCKLKDLGARSEQMMPIAELVPAVRRLLAGISDAG
jgi:histidyl-tRNA synthetase